ncbi:hypothetical protein FSP39_010222 [Pinctada imbricata]|uniref:EF-hand domain-containing protein n=1 Tax=Pinctada imbricata TaxID=66713 RepID=A0AA88Y9W5_PINIB|nr:hypothetical protein FSP39_010222 [Pinctada imbricata]
MAKIYTFIVFLYSVLGAQGRYMADLSDSSHLFSGGSSAPLAGGQGANFADSTDFTDVPVFAGKILEMTSKVMLAPFQKEKLKYYFQFFDTDGNELIEYKDLSGFLQKILDYTKWPNDSKEAREMTEVHDAFFEILMEKASHDEGCGKDERTVSLDDWYDLWSNLIVGSMGMGNFPVWLRLLPKSLFMIMDRDEDGVINEKELCDFYVNIVHLDPKEALSVSKKAFQDMTDHGRYPLNVSSYEQIFANFLLGRTPYGPGRYIFGCFEDSVEAKEFKLIQGPPTDDTDAAPKIARRGSTDQIKVRHVTRKM